MDNSTPGKILGIGGIFFKSVHREELGGWYRDKLGIEQHDFSSIFKWTSEEKPPRELMTVWSVFPSTSKYFGDGPQEYMINYIVDDMDAFLAKLEAAGVKIDPKRDNHDYGKFAWAFDSDGHKFELWEPR